MDNKHDADDNREPSRTISIAELLSSGKPVTDMLSKPQSLMSSIFTPPASPCSHTGSSKFAWSSNMSTNMAECELIDMSCKNVIVSFHFRFLASTSLGHRHTLPMLSWIVTDLIYKSRCHGEEIHAKLYECLRNEDKFADLRKSLFGAANQNGRKVEFSLIVVKNERPSVYFEVIDSMEETVLFHHCLSDIFLFGRFTRHANLFYYVCKDAKGGVPALFVFTTADETQLDELCRKYSHTRLVHQLDSSKHLFHNPNKLEVSSNCFEVLHVGSVAISTKRVTPSGIDKAVAMLNRSKQNEDVQEKKSNSIASLERPSKYHTKRFVVEVIDENEPLEMVKSKDQVESRQATTLISNTQSLDYETGRQLIKDLNKNRELAPSQSSRTHVRDIQFNQQGTMEESCHPSMAKRMSSDEVSIKSMSTMMLEGMKDGKECGRQGSASCTSEMSSNKPMLFIIAQMDICLISMQNHKTVLSKTFLNITHCSQGKENVDHFGIIVREPFVPHYYNETYVGHIFKCRTKDVTDELLSVLRLAFNNAYRANKISNCVAPVPSNNIMFGDADASNSNQPAYCANCPLNWFHQLCLDIDGLDNRTIFAFLMFRIQQNSSDDKRHEFERMLEKLQLDSSILEDKEKNEKHKVDMLMIVLKARMEKMQRRHEREGCRLNSCMSIYNQFEEDQHVHSTASLTKLEGLKLLAKNSLGSIFKASKKPSDAKRHSVQFNTPSSSFSHPSEQSSLSSSASRASFLNKTKSLDFGSKDPASLIKIFNPEEEDKTCIDEDLEANEEEAMGNQQNSKLRKTKGNVFGNININNSVETFMKYQPKPNELARQSAAYYAKAYEETTERLELAKIVYHKLVNREGKLEEWVVDTVDSLRKAGDGEDRNSQKGSQGVQCVYPSIGGMTDSMEAHLNQLWDSIISTFYIDKHKSLKQQRGSIASTLKIGVPLAQKQRVWQFLIDFHRAEFKLEDKKVPTDKFDALLQQLAPNQQAILTDLARTYPSLAYFEQPVSRGGEGQIALFNVLKAYALIDAEVGYCQGFAFIAGLLLLHMDEQSAFEMFHAILVEYDHRQFCKQTIDLSFQFFKLNRMLQDMKPKLYNLFLKLNLDESAWSASWFLTLFAEQFPIHFTSRFMDFYLFHGANAFFHIILALLTKFESRLMSTDSLEEMINILRSESCSMDNHEMLQLFTSAFAVDLAPKLTAYEIEYLTYKQEFAFNQLFEKSSKEERPLVTENAFKETLIKQLNQNNKKEQFLVVQHQNDVLKQRIVKDFHARERMEEALDGYRRSNKQHCLPNQKY